MSSFFLNDTEQLKWESSKKCASHLPFYRWGNEVTGLPKVIELIIVKLALAMSVCIPSSVPDGSPFEEMLPLASLPVSQVSSAFKRACGYVLLGNVNFFIKHLTMLQLCAVTHAFLFRKCPPRQLLLILWHPVGGLNQRGRSLRNSPFPFTPECWKLVSIIPVNIGDLFFLPPTTCYWQSRFCDIEV